MNDCGETKAPAGWYCSRVVGHKGPCAAWPMTEWASWSEWEADCIRWRGKILRGPDAHWCNDWDGLPVTAFTAEYDCCTDFKKTLLGRICNRLHIWYWNLLETKCRMDNETVAQREEWAHDFKQR
jgi:hypothetical protein